MSVQAMTWVIEKSQHKGSSFVVLLMIANHAHADGTSAHPSFECLARESRITVRQVTNIIPVLERSRELVVRHGRGPERTNDYTVNMMQAGLPMEKISIGKRRPRISSEPNTIREEKKEEPNTAVAALPVWVPKQEWDEFVEMRKKMRAWTKGAEKHTLDALWNLLNGKCESGHVQDLAAVLAQSVQRGWRGVFEVRNGNRQTRSESFEERRRGETAAAIQRVAGDASAAPSDLRRALPPTHP